MERSLVVGILLFLLVGILLLNIARATDIGGGFGINVCVGDCPNEDTNSTNQTNDNYDNSDNNDEEENDKGSPEKNKEEQENFYTQELILERYGTGKGDKKEIDRIILNSRSEKNPNKKLLAISTLFNSFLLLIFLIVLLRLNQKLLNKRKR